MESAARTSWERDPWAWYQAIRKAYDEYGIAPRNFNQVPGNYLHYNQHPGNYLHSITPRGSSTEDTFLHQSKTCQLTIYVLSADALLRRFGLQVTHWTIGLRADLDLCYDTLRRFLLDREPLDSDSQPVGSSFGNLNDAEVERRREAVVALVREYFVKPFELYEHLISAQDRDHHRVMPVDPEQEGLKPGFDHELALGTRKEIGRRAARRYNKHAGSGWSYSRV
ncbi:hypothetical protein JCM10908_000520 [Rhodotorula pacifica]|uniref:uncharacterized protein n=1 Tax=Rhodotorula pacifica TaxID=1495444 RepID=UPI00317BAFE5